MTKYENIAKLKERDIKNFQKDAEAKSGEFFFVWRFQQPSNLREDFYFVYIEVYPQIRRLHKKSPHKKSVETLYCALLIIF